MKIIHSATLIIASTVVILLLIASWQVQQNIAQQFRQDIGNSLNTVLNTTQQAVLSWQQEHVLATSVWASTPKMLRLTEALLASQRTPQTLTNATAQTELREWLRTVLKGKGYLGYFIINKDNISLASSRNDNIGSINLLSQQPQFIQRIWSGSGGLSLPMSSDVALDSKSLEFSHSMFVGAPIRNSSGQVIAVFTFRLDPAKDFSAILQRGRIGESGETYAFDKKGLLLSESRFDQQLRDIGLIAADSHGILGVSIRDPGSNLVTNERRVLSDSKRPLTLMAQNAIAGNNGKNLDGYRDYRGVPVVGVWLWDQQLNMGITTELDVAEAYANYYETRKVIIALTALAIILSILLTLALVWLKKKSSLDQLQRLELLRKQKNLELQEAEQRQKMILESAVEGVITINGQGKILFINCAAEKLFGYPKDEVLGKNVKLFVPEPHKSKHDGYLASYQQGRENGIIGRTIELEGQRKDGSTFPLDLSLSESQEADERIFVGFVHDLSALKSAQEELKMLSQAIEQSPVSVVITNPAGNIEYVNPRFHEITGYNNAEVLGKNPRLLKSGYTSDEQYKQMWKTITAGGEWLGEFKNIKKNGELYWESASISPIKNNNGKITHFLAIKENITERKQTQQELQQAKEDAELANTTKSEFLANMSHEIRTPLNGIIGMARLLADTQLEKRQRNYTNKLRSSSEILLGIINDILDFSKIEAGKLTIENVEFELDQVLANISNVITYKAEERNIELLFDVDPTTPYYLTGDPLRLNQVLLNLVSNAVKFTKEGEIVVKIRPEQLGPSKIKLIFSVTDSGIGLSQEQIQKLFNPFTQVDGSTTRKFGGTGLGLSICKQLVELMNGSISVTSELGKGSCFQFSVEFSLCSSKHNYLHTLPIDLRGLRVLVVDDCRMVLDILRYQLCSFGFHVDIAISGLQAMEKLLEADDDSPIQLVLMDWKMPKQDGLETATLIKQNSQLSLIPLIIMHSIYKWDEVQFEAERKGIDGYINKPVNRSTLFDVIMTTFHRKNELPIRDTEILSRDSQDWGCLAGYQILLVEDNFINQEVASEFLKSNGIDVFIANNGIEALELLKCTKIDLVLMDIQMPEMDGFQATRAIRAQDKFAELPIIAMTANAMSGDRDRCLAAGMNEHITKPIDPEKLFSSISFWLGMSEPTNQDSPIVREPQSYALELHEFDVLTALTRLNGNINAYLKLLGKFRRNFSDFIEQIYKQVNQADYENARALAHQLIGVAGNLSATTLHRIAIDVELELKSKNSLALTDMLNELELEMELVFSEIDGLDIDNMRLTDSNKTTGQGLSEQLTDFNALLEDYDASAIKYVEQLRTPLLNIGRKEDYNKIKDCLSNYDFDQALEICQKIVIDS